MRITFALVSVAIYHGMVTAAIIHGGNDAVVRVREPHFPPPLPILGPKPVPPPVPVGIPIGPDPSDSAVKARQPQLPGEPIPGLPLPIGDINSLVDDTLELIADGLVASGA